MTGSKNLTGCFRLFSALCLSLLIAIPATAADFDASLEEKKIVFTTEFSNTGSLDLTIGGGSLPESLLSSEDSTFSSVGLKLNLESDCEECGGLSGEITGAVVETKMSSKAYEINVEALLASGRAFGNYVFGGSSFFSVIDSPVTIEEFSKTIESTGEDGVYSSETIKKYYEDRADEVWTFVMDGGYAGFFTSAKGDEGNDGTLIPNAED
jgi:hypothetical protein